MAKRDFSGTEEDDMEQGATSPEQEMGFSSREAHSPDILHFETLDGTKCPQVILRHRNQSPLFKESHHSLGGEFLTLHLWEEPAPEWEKWSSRYKNVFLPAATWVTMIALLIIVVIFLWMFLTGKERKYPVCITPSCRALSTAIAASLDIRQDPCEDFYAYVCSGKHRDSTDLLLTVRDVF